MSLPWKEHLTFWNSGEWQVIEEKLSDLKKSGTLVNPAKARMFDALRAVPFEKVKVCILGQDPYPHHEDATGIAFHCLSNKLPATLVTIFKEYQEDLHYEVPSSGNLTKWMEQGVLLWNVIPSCLNGHSLSHHDMWLGDDVTLTREILQKLSQETSCVFAALGSIARNQANKYIDSNDSDVIYTSHPSPRGNKFSKSPFSGSRLFSSINDKLCAAGVEAINWRL